MISVYAYNLNFSWILEIPDKSVVDVKNGKINSDQKATLEWIRKISSVKKNTLFLFTLKKKYRQLHVATNRDAGPNFLCGGGGRATFI